MAKPTNENKVEVEWPNELGQFILADGTLGNPGCDGCGTLDAVVKINGRYYCSNIVGCP